MTIPSSRPFSQALSEPGDYSYLKTFINELETKIADEVERAGGQPPIAVPNPPLLVPESMAGRIFAILKSLFSYFSEPNNQPGLSSQRVRVLPSADFPGDLTTASITSWKALSQVIDDLIKAKGNIQLNGVSGLDRDQVGRIKEIAGKFYHPLFHYEYSMGVSPNPNPNPNPFKSTIIPAYWLKLVNNSLDDSAESPIVSLLRTRRETITNILREALTRKQDSETQTFLLNHLPQDIRTPERARELLQFIASSKETFHPLWSVLNDKEKNLLLSEFKKHKIPYPRFIKDLIANVLWFPLTAAKASIATALILSSFKGALGEVPGSSYLPSIPFLSQLHSKTSYALIGSFYTLAHWVFVSADDKHPVFGPIRLRVKMALYPLKWCYDTGKEVANGVVEAKNYVVSSVQETPIIGPALKGSKLAQIATITLLTKYCCDLGLSSVLPNEASVGAAFETMGTVVKVTFWGTTVMIPTILSTGYQLIRPFVSSTTIVGAITTGCMYWSEIGALTGRVSKVVITPLFSAISHIPNPKKIVRARIKAIQDLCPSFISSRLGLGKAAKIFATPLAKGKLSDVSQELDDAKYPLAIQRMARLTNSAITPFAIFMQSCLTFIEKNISHPENSRISLVKYCQFNDWKTESIEAFSSAVSTAEAVMNWGAKIPGLNILFGQLRTQIGVATAVASGAIGLSLMVIGNPVTKSAGEAILREFTVQGATNALRGFVETYFYLLSLVFTLPWDLSGHRLSLFGEKPSPLHMPLAITAIAKDTCKKVDERATREVY